MFREIVDFICSQTGFVRDVQLFPGQWPQDKLDRCLIVLENGGSIVPHEKDMTISMIQIISRAMDYWDARDDIYTVYNAIHATHGWNLPNWTGSGADYLAMSILALAVPQKVTQDENGRFLFSCNFQFYMEKASCTP